MQMVALTAAARSKETSAKKLRRTGLIPGIVYGNFENTPVQCEENALKKAYVQAGESTLVELAIGKKKVPVLFHAIDLDPVSDRPAHVDFYAVDMNKEVEASVPLHLEGEAPAVKNLAAIIVTPLDHVLVRALPANLPHHLAVSLETLIEFRSTITVADLSVPNGVTVLEASDTVLVVAQEPREEEVVAAPVVAEGAVATAEGAAPVEGAVPAEGTPPAAGKDAEKSESKKEKK